MLGIALANNIINYAIEINSPVTNLKLQGLLYLINLEHIKLYDEKLIDEDFEAWQYSPVLRSVYKEFVIYGNNQILKLQNSYGMNNNVEMLMKDVVNKYNSINTWDFTKILNSDKAYGFTIREKGIKSTIDFEILKKYLKI